MWVGACQGSPSRTRTGTSLRTRDFKSPASAVPPRGRPRDISSPHVLGEQETDDAPTYGRFGLSGAAAIQAWGRVVPCLHSRLRRCSGSSLWPHFREPQCTVIPGGVARSTQVGPVHLARSSPCSWALARLGPSQQHPLDHHRNWCRPIRIGMSLQPRLRLTENLLPRPLVRMWMQASGFNSSELRGR
jgi:hypothetical protein